MGPVAQALITADAAGTVCHVDRLGDPADVGAELVELAETYLSPLAAAALVAAATDRDGAWTPIAAAFAARLRQQTSYLALQDSLDLLLDSTAAAKAVAVPLYSALVEGHRDNLWTNPLLAAAHLEGALRLAIAGAVRPYRVLDGLTDITPTMSEDYLEKLPRLIGVALDAWEGNSTLTAPLATCLAALRDLDAPAPGAAYELACMHMRAALRQTDPAVASSALLEAAAEFTLARTLDESRDDAAAYAAVCTAIPSFGAAEVGRLTQAVDELEAAMRRRAAWMRNMHQPAWRRPKLNAEVEWLGILLNLRQVAARLSEPSWLEASAAVGQLARAYTAERSTRPAPGLVAIVRPAVENSVAANAVLVDQLTRAVEADRQRDRPTLPPAAELLVQAVREQRSAGAALDYDLPQDADEEGDEALNARIARLAPRVRDLGIVPARAFARQVPDEDLIALNRALTVLLASGVAEHPVLGRMRDDIVKQLDANPDFDGERRQAVIAMLDRTLTFLQDRYERGGALLRNGQDILRPLSKGEKRPVEADLQWEFYVWVANSEAFAGRATCEMPNIALGRVDVVVRIGELVLVTEVKRELKDASPSSLDQYVPQAAAYAGGNASFSQLLVLDLTDHSNGVPPLRDLAWVREHRARPDASPQHVVVAVVAGNRPTPRQLSDARRTSTTRRRCSPRKSATASPAPGEDGAATRGQPVQE